ncbi:MAG: diguanylate cyclase [Candidatus Omnitrophica bacterium]|nr:diguanylate cyclase [Candidatus Omnitrophota bacterium]
MEYHTIENHFLKLSKCFLSFSSDPIENINRLVTLCGELMGATCALYNRLDKDLLCSVGKWNAPSDYSLIDRAEGHICYDVIKYATEEIVFIRHLQNTPYANSDLNVKKYNLQTYIGRAVKFNDRYMGALCVVYQKDFVPTSEEEKLMGIISSAIGVEEERNQAKDELKKGIEEKALLLNNMLELVVYQDGANKIVWANKATADAFNTSPELLEGKICYKAFHNIDKPCKNCTVVRAQETGNIEEEEMVAPDGRVWIIRGIPVRDEAGNMKGILEVARDITEKKKYEKDVGQLNEELLKSNKKLARLVIKDPHTGLYNHRYFKEIMESEFYRTKRYNQLLSLIFIDIDYFRSVNDAYGYKFGDLVLKQFAQRLRKSVRMHDYAVRFGDEEFVIILPGSSKKGALELCQRISNSIKMFTFGDGKNTVRLRVSMAVVSYPEDGMSRSSEFIEIADKILNRAKEFGGDRICTISDMMDSSMVNDKITTAKHLKQKLVKLTKKSNQASIESIFAFAKTIELKDHYTGNHVERTVYYANEIAKRLRLPAEDIKLIEQASMLHDLGKIGISEKILLKKGPLTRREFNKIKSHPQIGVDIIRPIQSFHGLVPLILYHHERWDGKGYPFGLKGNEIPIGARIIAIADVYEALISDRPYRKALPKKEALRIIKENSGKQFDPKIADVLIEVLKKGRIKTL